MTTLETPVASIIIPVVNNLKHNRECLESLFAHTADPAHEIVVVDNGSTDGSREYFQSLGDKIRLVSNEGRRTFAQSCNQGAREARGQYLVFLNNDTRVTENWLAPMLACFQHDPQIGLVANKQLFPGDGTVSHVGGAFTPFGSPEHLYQYFDPNLPFLNCDRELQWVTACCIAIQNSLFHEVGGFDEGFQNSFEDVDLCFKVRSKGLKNFYCARSVIYHYGQATVGRGDHEDSNRKRFFQRWEAFISRDMLNFVDQDAVNEFLDRNHHKERLLYERYLLMRQVQNLEHEKTLLKHHIKGIYNTVSWRITEPIRAVKRLYVKWFKGGVG